MFCASLQEQLEDPQSVQEIYSYLIRVREGMDTEGENYSEVSELIAGIADLPAMNPPYDLQVDTIVTIGTKEYSIDFISDEMVVLRDQMYPLFTEEMPREVFDRRVRENPANDHLKVYRKPSEEPAEKDKGGTGSHTGNGAGAGGRIYRDKTGGQSF